MVLDGLCEVNRNADGMVVTYQQFDSGVKRAILTY